SCCTEAAALTRMASMNLSNEPGASWVFRMRQYMSTPFCFNVVARLYTRNSKMPQRPGRLNGLRHLALTAPNLEECERFYVDVLGMEVLNRGSKDLVYLACGNDNRSLGRASEISSGLQAMDPYGFIVDSLEDLHACYEYVKAQGGTMLDRP